LRLSRLRANSERLNAEKPPTTDVGVCLIRDESKHLEPVTDDARWERFFGGTVDLMRKSSRPVKKMPLFSAQTPERSKTDYCTPPPRGLRRNAKNAENR
jgi:hypothetical protein